jgi:hypothetical protein
MQSEQRYRGAAQLAETARASAIAAHDDARAVRCGEAWAAFVTAANHARLAARWRINAAADRQTAAQPPANADLWTPRFVRAAPRADLAAQWEARVREAQRIAAAHERAAEEWGERGEQLAAAQSASVQQTANRARRPGSEQSS